MSDLRSGPPTRAEVCAVALAECFRGNGEILANPIGTLPVIGGRLGPALLSEGGDNDAIAQTLVISPQTARTHIHN